MRKLIISAVGQDKPGIVAAFTQVLFDTHCNIEDTSMTLLEDHFTMLYIAHAPEAITVEALKQKLQTVLRDYNLQLNIDTIDTGRESLDATGRPWTISVSGSDHTGIMYHVTQYLSEQRINIRHLSSKRLTRPGGETLFLMAVEVDVPEALSEDKLLADLADVARTESLEIHAEPLEVYTL